MTESKAEYKVARGPRGPHEDKQGDDHVLLFSGGLDSYLAYLALKSEGYNPKLLYVEHGSKNNDEQLYHAKRLAKKHDEKLIIDRTFNLGHWETETAFIPNRNGLLGMIASNYGQRIWMAIMDGEQSYSDCKQETFISLSVTLTKLNGHRAILVDSPFWEYTKAEVIQRLDEKYLKSLLDSYSCHKGGLKHCGYCSACFRRACAFALNKIHSKNQYEVDPFKTGLAEDYWEKVTGSKDSGYGEKRDNEIIEAMKLYGWGD